MQIKNGFMTMVAILLAACGGTKHAEDVPHTETVASPARDTPDPSPAPTSKPTLTPEPATSSNDAILLGHAGPFTGTDAIFGQSVDDGLKLAIGRQNRQGGIRGRKLVLMTHDDQGKPEEAAAAVTRLIDVDRVSLIFGEVASSRSYVIAPIVDANHIPMISPAATNPKVTQDGDHTRPYVFRVCFIDPFQGTAMAKFAWEHLKVHHAAILRDVSAEYSVSLANTFAADFAKLGGTIISDAAYRAGDRDLKAQLTKLKAQRPDVIYVPGYSEDVARIALQARELGLKQPLLGGDGWDSTRLLEVAKGALDGSYFTNHYSPADPSPEVQRFVADYSAAYGRTPDALAALGYDAANLSFDAMSRAKDLTPAAIRDALEQTRSFHGVTGSIRMDAQHNPIKSAVIFSIKQNRAGYAGTIEP